MWVFLGKKNDQRHGYSRRIFAYTIAFSLTTLLCFSAGSLVASQSVTAEEISDATASTAAEPSLSIDHEGTADFVESDDVVEAVPEASQPDEVPETPFSSESVNDDSGDFSLTTLDSREFPDESRTRVKRQAPPTNVTLIKVVDDLVGGAVRPTAVTVVDGTPVLLGSFAPDTACTLVETDPQGARVSYSPSQNFTVTAGGPMAVTVTNTYTASVFVNKDVVDLTPGPPRPPTYAATLTCSVPPGHESIPPIPLTLTPGAPPQEVTNIPVDSTCVVTETDSQGATVTYTPGQLFTVVQPTPGSVDGGRVTVVNTFPAAPEAVTAPEAVEQQGLAVAGFDSASIALVGLMAAAAGFLVLTLTRRRRVS
jgi:hypothetical protein